jgi:hypothetical protein
MDLGIEVEPTLNSMDYPPIGEALEGLSDAWIVP